MVIVYYLKMTQVTQLVVSVSISKVLKELGGQAPLI